MNKKDLAKMARRLTLIDEETAGKTYQKNQERLKILIDLVILVAAIIIFMLILFNNPDMNYIPLLIATCAVTGLAIVRAFAHGNRISEVNSALRKLKEEAVNINTKIENSKPKSKSDKQLGASLSDTEDEAAPLPSGDQPTENETEQQDSPEEVHEERK